ncbi:proteoglycan 4-like [Rhipicephalus sanguineus]|uniref:proteoglycan 4-like n=1 Tax=Rhipicephalus sanguineus TaxID=34632 RepID=UPI0020C29A41|nr:proteoglycan 4-like [Rhipicephalus sanguineus]
MPQRAVPAGPQPSLDHDDTSLITTPPTSRPATSASIPAPDHPRDEVQEAPAAIGQSTEKSVFSTASAHGPSDVLAICTSSPTPMAHDTYDTSGSTMATSPHALECSLDTDIVPPAIRPPIAEASPAMMSDEPQRPTSPSQSLAAEFPAPNHRWPNFRDAATMTDAPEEDVPGQRTPELTAYVTPATEAHIQHADLRTSPREPTTVETFTSTGSPSEPAAETTPAQLHHRFPAEPLTQDTIHPTMKPSPSRVSMGGGGIPSCVVM